MRSGKRVSIMHILHYVLVVRGNLGFISGWSVLHNEYTMEVQEGPTHGVSNGSYWTTDAQGHSIVIILAVTELWFEKALGVQSKADSVCVGDLKATYAEVHTGKCNLVSICMYYMNTHECVYFRMWWHIALAKLCFTLMIWALWCMSTPIYV